MSTAAGALQSAIYTALSNDATLSALITGVYDWTPENATYPYISLADDYTEQKWNTLGKVGKDITFNIHVWSQYTGNKEANSISSAIDDVLDDTTLSVTGYTNVLTQFEVADKLIEDSTGKKETRHIIMSYRVILQES